MPPDGAETARAMGQQKVSIDTNARTSNSSVNRVGVAQDVQHTPKKKMVKFDDVGPEKPPRAVSKMKKIAAVPESGKAAFSSRRLVNYDDDNSCATDSDYEEDDETSNKVTETATSYVNTQGNVEVRKPHPSFKNYANVF